MSGIIVTTDDLTDDATAKSRLSRISSCWYGACIAGWRPISTETFRACFTAAQCTAAQESLGSTSSGTSVGVDPEDDTEVMSYIGCPLGRTPSSAYNFASRGLGKDLGGKDLGGVHGRLYIASRTLPPVVGWGRTLVGRTLVGSMAGCT